jgi:hypothetical protein
VDPAGGVGQPCGCGVPAVPSLPLVDGVPPDGEEEDDVDGAPEVLGCPPDWPDCWPDSPEDPGGCEEGIDGDDGEEDGDEGDDDGIDGIVGIEVELLLDAQPPAATAAVRSAILARPRVDRCMTDLGTCGKPPAQLLFASTAHTWMHREPRGSKSALSPLSRTGGTCSRRGTRRPTGRHAHGGADTQVHVVAFQERA